MQTDYQDNFYIETSSTAPGSAVAGFQEVAIDPQLLARQYAQKRANISGYDSVATVWDSDQEEVASAWASPEEKRGGDVGSRGERGGFRKRGAR